MTAGRSRTFDQQPQNKSVVATPNNVCWPDCGGFPRRATPKSFSGNVNRLAKLGTVVIAASIVILGFALGLEFVLPNSLWSDIHVGDASEHLAKPYFWVSNESYGEVEFLNVELLTPDGRQVVRDASCPCGAICVHTPQVLAPDSLVSGLWDGKLADCSDAPRGRYLSRLVLTGGGHIRGSEVDL